MGIDDCLDTKLRYWHYTTRQLEKEKDELMKLMLDFKKEREELKKRIELLENKKQL